MHAQAGAMSYDGALDERACHFPAWNLGDGRVPRYAPPSDDGGHAGEKS